MGDVVCKGSWSLGTACGTCSRCEATRPHEGLLAPYTADDPRLGLTSTAALVPIAEAIDLCEEICERAGALGISLAKFPTEHILSLIASAKRAP